MKTFFAVGIALFASQCACVANAMELCDSQDYYHLANATQCSIDYRKAGHKDDPQTSMFEIMKNYPFEQKDAFVKVLQRKVELIDSVSTQRQGQTQTEKVTADLSKLAQAKHALLGHIEAVKVARQDNWVSVRDQARTALEETARSLRNVE